jgi:hypothetical protein
MCGSEVSESLSTRRSPPFEGLPPKNWLGFVAAVPVAVDWRGGLACGNPEPQLAEGDRT